MWCMNAQRQEFLTRCLNAAANLYGIVSYGEFTMLYNRYSADKASPVSDPLRPEEIDEMKRCLENLSGRHLKLQIEQDDSLLGGFVGYVEGKVYDFSYAAQLHELQRTLG